MSKKTFFVFSFFFIISITGCKGKETRLSDGKQLYDIHCAGCHGVKGNGNGPMAKYLFPKPRDLTSGIFKYRTTQGPIPADIDILQTLKVGVPGTSMPGWDVLKQEDWKNLLAYLKTLSPRLEKGSPGKPIDVPEEPKNKTESIAAGKALYGNAGCVACHGVEAKGDGPAANALKDVWGNTIIPRDLTSGPLKWGDAGRDIYRSLWNGVPGTPMPAYGSTFTGKQLWSLAHYIQSIQQKLPEGYDPSNPKRNLIKMGSVTGELPNDCSAPAWQNIKSAPVFLKPLWFEKGETEWVEVKALHNKKEAAFCLSWEDDQVNIALTMSDAVALQFPVKPITNPVQLPYLGLGNPGNPVDIWLWKPQGAIELSAVGVGTQRSGNAGEQIITGNGVYQDGHWTVIIKGPLEQRSPKATRFAPVGYLSFALWDADIPKQLGLHSFSEWMIYEMEGMPGK